MSFLSKGMLKIGLPNKTKLQQKQVTFLSQSSEASDHSFVFVCALLWKFFVVFIVVCLCASSSCMSTTQRQRIWDSNLSLCIVNANSGLLNPTLPTLCWWYPTLQDSVLTCLPFICLCSFREPESLHSSFEGHVVSKFELNWKLASLFILFGMSSNPRWNDQTLSL